MHPLFKTRWATLILLFAGSAWAQTNFLVPHTAGAGYLLFGRVPNTVEYRIEWALSENGPWTTMTHAAEISGILLSTSMAPASVQVPLLFRVIARSYDPNAPEGMVTIPGGPFERGADTNLFPEAGLNETPVHTIHVSTFYMDRYEVTGALWSEVLAWAYTNGYLMSSPSFKAANHPLHSITWYDALKFCNARSEREGLTPCYISSGGVYRAGIDTNVTCDFTANGYRLPTSAEWEKAAKGGFNQLRFPWTDFTNRISHARANYRAENLWHFDLSLGYHPAYSNAPQPFTSPVGSFPPNAYGLHDMAGNVSEWCWDWHDIDPYSATPSHDPTGPAGPHPSTIPIGGPIIKTIRGGSWGTFPEFVRLTYRGGAFPSVAYDYVGLRCVRRP